MPRTTAADIRDLDARAMTVSLAVVSNVTAAHLRRPTPCAEWTLRELLEHLIVQHLGFAAAADRNGADPAAWQPPPLGEDPAATHAAAAERLLAAFAADGVLAREFQFPASITRQTFPGSQAIKFHFLDCVVHTWDVARSLGLPVEFDAGVLDEALTLARGFPDGETRLAPGAPFGPSVAAPAAAGSLDRVVALLGRSPAWPD